MTCDATVLNELRDQFKQVLMLETAMALRIQLQERDSSFYLVVDYNQVPETANFKLGPGENYPVQFIRPFLPVEFRSIEPVFDTDLKTMTYCLGTVFDILVKTQ